MIAFATDPIGLNAEQKRKHAEAYAGIDNMFKLTKKIGFDKIVFGTDIITDPNLIARMNEEFTFRKKWFTPVEILPQATSRGRELLDLSIRFNPGKLGVIEEGALADILLVNGDPLKDISIFTKPDENLALIMKEGKSTRIRSDDRWRVVRTQFGEEGMDAGSVMCNACAMGNGILGGVNVNRRMLMRCAGAANLLAVWPIGEPVPSRASITASSL